MDRIILIVAVFLFTTIAAIVDFRTRKISNALVVPAFLIACVFHLVRGGLDSGLGGAGLSILFALGGFAVGFAALFVLWLIGGCGGGDVKYMAALGAWLGPQMTLQVLLLSGLFAAVNTVFLMGLKLIRRDLTDAKSPKRSEGPPGKASPGVPSPRERLMPLAVPAWLATMCVLILSEFVLK